MHVAVVPMKDLARAKSRLAAALDPEQRRALCLAMLRDVLRALLATPGLDAVRVVSRDPGVLGAAAAAGATPCPDVAADLNGALAAVAAGLGPADSLLVVPGDVPLVQPGDVQLLMATAALPGGAIVRTGDGGTGALWLRPPTAIRFQFGPDSFRHHLAAARQAGVPLRVCRAPGLALDVDRPDDLQPVLLARERAESGRLLAQYRGHKKGKICIDLCAQP